MVFKFFYYESRIEAFNWFNGTIGKFTDLLYLIVNRTWVMTKVTKPLAGVKHIKAKKELPTLPKYTIYKGIPMEM